MDNQREHTMLLLMNSYVPTKEKVPEFAKQASDASFPIDYQVGYNEET